MTKQLITLIGILVSAAVIVAAVLLGVVPLIGGAFSADSQRRQVETTNAAYETQIRTLTEQKKDLADIQAAVAQLRAQIPEKELLNEVFERISRAATSAGVTATAASRGDLAPYAPRTGTDDDAASAPAPSTTPPADSAAPIDQAEGVAGQAGANAAGTGAGPGTPAATAPPAAPARGQVQVSIDVDASDIAKAFEFLDGLRAGPRAIAIDTVSTTPSVDGYKMKITAIAFLHSSGGE